MHTAQENAENFTEMQQDHNLALANLTTSTKAEWGKAITKNFFTWPGLSLDLVHKQLMEKQSTILGHFQQPQKGLRSTQEKVMHSEPDPEQY